MVALSGDCGYVGSSMEKATAERDSQTAENSPTDQ